MLVSWLVSAAVTCLAGAQTSLSSLFGNSSQLDWGSYRPNLYFGLRTRSPTSPLTGLIWYGIHDYASVSKARHSCEQDDGVKYNWVKHDGRSAGIQIVEDPQNNVKMSISFLKSPGGINGGSWAVRVKGEPIDAGRLSRISLIHYLALQEDGTIELDTDGEDEDGIDRSVKISGSTAHLGDFDLRIVEGRSTTPLSRGRHADDFGDKADRFHYLAMKLPDGQAWRAKDYFLSEATQNAAAMFEKYGQDALPDPAVLVMLPDDVRFGSNSIAIQRSFEGQFELDIYFDSKSMPSPPMDSLSLSAGLEAFAASYDTRFENTFGLGARDFSTEQVDFARIMTSSMIGGIGYFHGSSIVDRSFSFDYDDPASLGLGDEKSRDPDPKLTEPHELFTATPSRPFFPRGFYWDEGFHLQLIGLWDNDLSLEILKSWVDLIDNDGWVAREQILGEEARSKVPKDFWVQYPHYANPPTLTIAVTAFINKLQSRHGSLSDADLSLDARQSAMMGSSAEGAAESASRRLLDDPALAAQYLTTIYPKLRRHYLWFRKSQKGQITEWGRKASSRTEAYRWRGRSETHVLTSGLDDYPRAKPPHIGELHLDLACWVAFFSRTMSEIAEYLHLEEDLEEYRHAYKGVIANIEDLHWNEESKMYCDLSVDAEDESYFVCHKGYISLFPLILGLLDADNPHLGNLLDMTKDPEHLWSPFGILSLSKSDKYFGQDENYWRGPVWVHMNYLALQALKTKYVAQPGPHQKNAQAVYNELRSNLIDNLLRVFQQTGFVWEQYNAETGDGQRSRPFTGWSALITNIMAEIY